MEDGSRLPWIFAILLLFCAVYFAVTEISIASVSKAKIRAAAERGEKRAKNVLYVLDNFDRAITTLLIGTNIVHIGIATLVTVAVTKKWGVNAVTVSTIITTLVIFFAGEMLPKSIAKKYATSCSKMTCGFLRMLMVFFSPLSFVLSSIGQFVSKLAKSDPEITVTTDELHDIIEDMTEDGTLDENRGELISSALNFGDLTVGQIMTHRKNVEAISISETPAEILAKVKATTTHTRLPVYEGTVDNIIGILQIRKFIKAYMHEKEKVDVRGLLGEAMYVSCDDFVDDVLPLMTRRKMNIAVVTDPYGGTYGIITIEDILEEIVGDIYDEDDELPSLLSAEGGARA